MSRRGERHPPKKKHPNKPRPPPVVPLTELERTTKAQQEFEKAMIHLVEAERMESGELKESGLILSRARTDRMVADYDLVRGVSNSDATATAKEARRFVDACKAKWGFYDNVTDDLDC
jgi:hypothetical protein